MPSSISSFIHACIHFPIRQTSSLKVRISVTKQHLRLLQLQIRDHMTWVYFLHARWKLPCCLASLAILLSMTSLSLASVPCPGVMASAIVCRTCNLQTFHNSVVLVPSNVHAHKPLEHVCCNPTACSCLCVESGVRVSIVSAMS